MHIDDSFDNENPFVLLRNSSDQFSLQYWSSSPQPATTPSIEPDHGTEPTCPDDESPCFCTSGRLKSQPRRTPRPRAPRHRTPRQETKPWLKKFVSITFVCFCLLRSLCCKVSPRSLGRSHPSVLCHLLRQLLFPSTIGAGLLTVHFSACRTLLATRRNCVQTHGSSQPSPPSGTIPMIASQRSRLHPEHNGIVPSLDTILEVLAIWTWNWVDGFVSHKLEFPYANQRTTR